MGANHAATIFRALRKKLGLTQSEWGAKFGISQSYVCLVESNNRTMQAPLWAAICAEYGIPSHSMQSGYVDLVSPLHGLKYDGIGDYRLPTKYSYAQGTSTRLQVGYLNFMRRFHANEDVNQLILSLGLDPDYFVFLNHPTNFRLSCDLINFLISKGHLNSKTLFPFAHSVVRQGFKVFVNHLPSLDGDCIDFYQAFVDAMSYMEINNKYVVERRGLGFIEISVAEGDLAREFRNRGEYDGFVCQYRAEALRAVGRLWQEDNVRIEKRACEFSGHRKAGRCIYRVSLM